MESTAATVNGLVLNGLQRTTKEAEVQNTQLNVSTDGRNAQ
jgi:hypothetical protein